MRENHVAKVIGDCLFQLSCSFQFAIAVRDGGADGSFVSDVSLIFLLYIFVARKMPKTQVKYKKAPQAPRRFKSSYMFFSTEKHKQIRKELSEEEGELKKVGCKGVIL
jgi:hypothetical protein